MRSSYGERLRKSGLTASCHYFHTVSARCLRTWRYPDWKCVQKYPRYMIQELCRGNVNVISFTEHALLALFKAMSKLIQRPIHLLLIRRRLPVKMMFPPISFLACLSPSPPSKALLTLLVFLLAHLFLVRMGSSRPL